jgi:predicted lipoprotein with Yx(FWY)xxD motif
VLPSEETKCIWSTKRLKRGEGRRLSHDVDLVVLESGSLGRPKYAGLCRAIQAERTNALLNMHKTLSRTILSVLAALAVAALAADAQAGPRQEVEAVVRHAHNYCLSRCHQYESGREACNRYLNMNYAPWGQVVQALQSGDRSKFDRALHRINFQFDDDGSGGQITDSITAPCITRKQLSSSLNRMHRIWQKHHPVHSQSK